MRSSLSGLSLLASILVTAGCGGDRVAELTAQLGSDDVEVRRAAARGLAEFGAAAAPAVPRLAQALDDADRDVRRLACRALGKIGPGASEAEAELIDALEDKQLPVRLAGAFALVELAPGNEAAHEVLIETMKLGEGGTIVAVGQLGERAGWAVPALVQLLQGDRRPGIRRLAAEALGRIGEEAALEPLERARGDRDDRVRESASAALELIRGGGEK